MRRAQDIGSPAAAARNRGRVPDGSPPHSLGQGPSLLPCRARINAYPRTLAAEGKGENQPERACQVWSSESDASSRLPKNKRICFFTCRQYGGSGNSFAA